jgi:predicted nucleic acid-binding protein
MTKEILDDAFDLYSRRSDKEWGMTDCVSFVVMRERGLLEALTMDQHFQQAGFRALLREP